MSHSVGEDDTYPAPAVGVIGAYSGDSTTIVILIIFFASLTWYNAVELLALIFITFKVRKGLYFWSLLISTLGLVIYTLGYLLKLLGALPGQTRWIGLIFLTIGWWTMVTGQSVVLWSRLHLVLPPGTRSDRILTWTKWMIIANVMVLHFPTTAVTLGSNASDVLSAAATQNFVKAYNVIEKFQMTCFCIQETILSSIYIVSTFSLLQTASVLRASSRSIARQLLIINALIILMDVGLLAIEYASLFLLETILKGFTYSVKLKLEFAILSRLVQSIQGEGATAQQQQTYSDRADSVGVGPVRTASSGLVDFAVLKNGDEDTDDRVGGRGVRKDTGHSTSARSSPSKPAVDEVENILQENRKYLGRAAARSPERW